MPILEELTTADRKAAWLKLMRHELQNAPLSLMETNANYHRDYLAIREALDRIEARQ